MSADYTSLPDDLPVPVDDGAVDGLVGKPLPDLALPATAGGAPAPVAAADPGSLAAADEPPAAARGYRLSEAPPLLVAYVYPMTGVPGVALPHGWDDIPGARDCTRRPAPTATHSRSSSTSAPPSSGSALGRQAVERRRGIFFGPCRFATIGALGRRRRSRSEAFRRCSS